MAQRDLNSAEPAVVWPPDSDLPRIREGHYGLIVAEQGRIVEIRMRRFPKLLAWPEIWPCGASYHPRGPVDRCWLYYNQPRRFPNFLALKYVATTAGSRYATFRAALAGLDAIAALKGVDAILCDAANRRLSDRLLARLGWTPHKPQRWHRNFIKRLAPSC